MVTVPNRELAPRLLLDIWYTRSMVCTWGGAVPDDTILMILSKIRYLLDTISAHLRAEMWSELVDWASEWPLAVLVW